MKINLLINQLINKLMHDINNINSWKMFIVTKAQSLCCDTEALTLSLYWL
jgi:hypothetical protein